MVSINTTDFEQHGGYYAIQLFHTNEITNTPKILTNSNAYQLVITPDTSSAEIFQVSESLSIKESARQTKSGLEYNINAQFDIPLQNIEVDNFFNNYVNNHVFIIGLKHYDQSKIYGSKFHPLKLIYEFVNGKKLEDGSLVRVKITGKIPQKPVFITD